MDKKILNRFERRRLRTRDKLKQSALKLILRKGYESVTIQDITDHADLGRATFYIHFKGKEELIREVIFPGWGKFTQRIEELKNNDVSDKPTLYYGLLQDFQLAEQNRDLYKILYRGSVPRSLMKQVKENIITYVEEGVRSGIFFSRTDFPPELSARFMAGALQELISWWLEDPGTYSAEQMANMTYQMFRGLE